MDFLTQQDETILEAIKCARHVQDYIWGEDSLGNDSYFDVSIWLHVFQKRVNKIAEIDFNNSSWKIELRKRLLQQAALSIQALELLETLK